MGMVQGTPSERDRGKEIGVDPRGGQRHLYNLWRFDEASMQNHLAG